MQNEETPWAGAPNLALLTSLFVAPVPMDADLTAMSERRNAHQTVMLTLGTL